MLKSPGEMVRTRPAGIMAMGIGRERDIFSAPVLHEDVQISTLFISDIEFVEFAVVAKQLGIVIRE